MGFVHLSQSGYGAPEDGWASEGVVNDTGEATLSAEGCNSWNVGHLQQRVADSFNVEHLHPSANAHTGSTLPMRP